MAPKLALLALTLSAGAAATSATAQTRTLDPSLTDIPPGVMRTISFAADGHPVVVDRPYTGRQDIQPVQVVTVQTTEEDEDGNPITSNLMDYAMPSAAELCSFETSNTQTDSPRNPLGAKGIGESGTIGSTPAIQNAVVDAVSHLGVIHIDMPCTAERVVTFWKTRQAA